MNEKKKKSGCWLPALLLIGGVIFIFSPLNPFMEIRGEDGYMTNASWLVTMVMLVGLVWFLVERFKDKE